MRRSSRLSSALLWAAAILAAAVSGAPAHYTLLILPVLAVMALLWPVESLPAKFSCSPRSPNEEGRCR